MKTSAKLLFTAVLATCSTIAFIPTTHAKADTLPLKSITITQYKNFLQNYSKADAIKSGISGKDISPAVDGATTQLAKFNGLSHNEQQQIVDGFILGKRPTNLEKRFANPSNLLQIRSSYGFSNSKKNRSTQLTYDTSSSFGIRLRVKVNYVSSGFNVLYTTSSDNRVISDYDPAIDYRLEATKRHVSQDNQGYTWARFGGYYNWGGGITGKGHELNMSVGGDYAGYRAYTHVWSEN